LFARAPAGNRLFADVQFRYPVALTDVIVFVADFPDRPAIVIALPLGFLGPAEFAVIG
jgi:hypothetical protein